MSVVELLTHFSYPAIFGLLLACGVGAPLSEELILLGTGALVAKGICHPAAAVAVAFAGVLGGDLLLFGIGKRLGNRALSSRRVQRFCPPARREALARRFERWGVLAIFGARFVAGLRACTFFSAGLLGVPRRRFAIADALGAAIWVPLVVLLARQLTPLLHAPAFAAVRHGVIAAVLLAVLILGARRLAQFVAGASKLEDAER